MAVGRYRGKINARVILLGASSAAGIFALGWLMPWWLTGGLAYAVMVLFALRFPERGVVLTAAVAGSLITVFTHLFPHELAPASGLIFLHCLLWVVAIWITVKVILGRWRVEDERAQLFDHALDLVCVASLDGSVKSVNPAFERALGYTARELMAGPYLDLIHPDDRAKATIEIEKLARRTPLTNLEVRVRAKDGSYRWLEWAAFPLAREGLVFKVGRDITEQKEVEAALQRSETQIRRSETALAALAAKLIATQEEERRHLARELHDDLSQRLTLLGMEAAKLQQQLASEPGLVRERLQWLEEQLGNLSDDIRAMSHQIHPAVLDYLGLAAALEAECEAFSKREEILVSFRRENVPEPIPEDISICLYRIAQESLRNVAKHAHASQAAVKLAGVEGAVVLSIFDSGVGFDQEAAAGKGGLGLVSMQERARLVNGTLSITSWPGEGTEISVSVPLGGGQR